MRIVATRKAGPAHPGSHAHAVRLPHLHPSIDQVLAITVGLIALIIIVFTFRDYGITWDEQWHEIYGEYVIGWYTSFFKDSRALDFWVLKYYGGLFDTIANSFARFVSWDRYDARHFCNAAFAMIGVVAALRIAAQLHGLRAGILAAVMLVLVPRYWGHAFFNATDIPFAALFTLALYYLLLALREQPHPRWSIVMRFAIAAGFASGVRVGGVILLFFYAFGALAWAFQQRTHNPRAWLPTFTRSLVLQGLVIAVVAYAVMLLAWPAAQVNPLRHPYESFRIVGHLPFGPDSVYFDGRTVATANLPWDYIPRWFLVTQPEFVLAGLLLGVLLLAYRFRSALADARAPEYATLIFAVAFPVVYAIVTHAKLYDEVRHFLFLVPSLCVLAAGAWATAIARARRMRVLLLAPLSIAMVLTVREMVMLHPYQYVYFNHVFGGGLRRASLSYETEYWGSSYREGVQWLKARYPARSDGERWRVTSCSFPFSTTHFLPRKRFRYVPLHKGRADLFLATTRLGCDRTVPGRVVHIIERDGVPLLYIKEVSGAPALPAIPVTGRSIL